MTEAAIQKLKRQFILITMSALIVTMTMIAGFLYLGNMLISRQAIRNTLDFIIENNGELADTEDTDQESGNSGQRSQITDLHLLDDIFKMDGHRSLEFRYSTRYFVVIFDENEEITQVKTDFITTVSEEQAEEYGRTVLESGKGFGRYGNYYYRMKVREDETSIVVFLDSENSLKYNQRLLYLALALISFGMILAFLIVRVLSTKVIQHEARNIELQKQFLTNASHELKTPLAVIRANTEMSEILDGETEWTQSTKRQIDRMNGLIKNLVMITRADENHGHLETEDVDVTKAIRETVENFEVLAEQNQKKMTCRLAENVHMHAEDAQIRQLCSLLVENAIKYCDDGGNIEVALTQKGRGIILVVSNDYAEGENVNYERFFERFYREDESHNTDKGGYGIGLSIAESLTRQYHGSIHATWKKGVISFTCQLRPVR